MKYIKKFELSSGKDPSSINNFINYVLSFYGKTGLYSKMFNGLLDQKIIDVYLPEFLKKLTEVNKQFYGDSYDRELFRDYLLFKLGYNKIGELEHNIRPFLTDFEINTDKFNV